MTVSVLSTVFLTKYDFTGISNVSFYLFYIFDLFHNKQMDSNYFIFVFHLDYLYLWHFIDT